MKVFFLISEIFFRDFSIPPFANSNIFFGLLRGCDCCKFSSSLLCEAVTALRMFFFLFLVAAVFFSIFYCCFFCFNFCCYSVFQSLLLLCFSISITALFFSISITALFFSNSITALFFFNFYTVWLWSVMCVCWLLLLLVFIFLTWFICCFVTKLHFFFACSN